MAIGSSTHIAELRRLVAGPVLTPDDPGFGDEVAGFNTAVQHRPAVAVGATRTADVQAAVRWAADQGLVVSVQATGHGAARPLAGGVLLTTKRMQGLRIDPHTRLATIGAGVKWRSVIDVAAPLGLAPLSGSSSDVGAVGYTLGGGLPILGRTFGFASDQVRWFELVTADGIARRVSADQDPDLFWALRGGKAQIGVVTSMITELVPVRTVYGGGIFYPGAAAASVLHAFREWAAGLPEAATPALALLRLPPMPELPEPIRGKFVVHLRFAFVGDPADGERLLAPMHQAAPVIMHNVRELPYTEADSIHQDPEQPLPVRESSVLLDALTPEAVAALLSVAGPGSDCPLLMVELRQLGGALARAPRGGDAVGIRGAGYCVLFLGVLFPEVAAAVPGTLVSAAAELAPYATGATFVNMHGTPSSEQDLARPWPHDVYRRLCDIKERFDPEGRFRFVHAFAPEDA
jgi:FAD/FMN-containing dehydrogenase